MGKQNRDLTVGFVGNPNCGKTTLFNDFTGASLKVANWPGVTVEKKEGTYRFDGATYKLVDTPGIYSLSSYTLEEQVTRDFVTSDEVDVIVNVVDAASLERNLYLTLQLLELGKPVVVALNMMDIVKKRGMEIDLHRLPEMLGAPCIAVSAQKKDGLNTLMHAVEHHGEIDFSDRHRVRDRIIHHHHEKEISDKHNEFAMVYSDAIENRIDEIKKALNETYGASISNHRWVAIKLLENDGIISKKYPLDLPMVLDHSYEKEIINEKYLFIDEVIAECVYDKNGRSAFTDRLDRIFCHNFLGIPAFLCVMGLMFLLTFTVGDWFKGYLEMGIDRFSALLSTGLTAVHCSPMLISLIVDGIIAGVGGIITFLPNLVILFLVLALLEDTGYLARAAYVMNGLMGKLGLSGRAFIPMILGFGCTVPALMASKVLEDEKDRRRTMIVTPFMSCAARLPIYILFAGLFFPEHPSLIAFCMYLIGLMVAIMVAFVLNKMDRSDKEDLLLMELPEYKIPSAHTVWIYVWEKVKDYLTKAGTIIFLASVIIWFILNFGPTGYVIEMADSFGAVLGSILVPVLAPVGLGFWQVVVALIAGISAKEVVVSSFIVLFGITGTETAAEISAITGSLNAIGFGKLNALCMMIFCLLYVPCAATLATQRKEFGSTAAMVKLALFQIAVAWVVCLLVYQIGLLL